MPHAISVNGLSKSFGARVAVQELNFHVSYGEIFGLLGPNGAGKTTTVRMLAGLLTPTHGSAHCAEVDVRNEKKSGVLRSRVGLLTEQPGLYERLSIRENLEFFIRLFEVNRSDAWKRVNEMLGALELGRRLDEPVGGFSKGMRQKVALVRALLHAPRVVFLDEPTSGLDPQATSIVREMVMKVVSEGAAVVLCSHNLYEVEKLCQRVALIKTTQRTVSTIAELKGEQKTVQIDLVNEFEVKFPLPAGVGLVSEGKVEVSAQLKFNVENDKATAETVGWLVAQGAQIKKVQQLGDSLESAYLKMISESEEE